MSEIEDKIAELESQLAELREKKSTINTAIVTAVVPNSAGGWEVQTSDGVKHVVSGEMVRAAGAGAPSHLMDLRYLFHDDANGNAVKVVCSYDDAVEAKRKANMPPPVDEPAAAADGDGGEKKTDSETGAA